MSDARPMEIVASPELISVLNVFVLFHDLLWKAKLDFDCLEPKPRLVVCWRFIQYGFHASCGFMKIPSCIIHEYEKEGLIFTCPDAGQCHFFMFYPDGYI